MLEIYTQIDYLLREMVSGTKLTFTTIRARFLYVATEYKLSETFIKYGSIVFNWHHRVVSTGYQCSELENQLFCYLYQELHNIHSSEKIYLLPETVVEKFESLLYRSEQRKNVEELILYINQVNISETKHGFPRYELIGKNLDGEDITINLWLDSKPEQTVFYRRYDLIADFFSSNKQIRFFNLSWSEQGFYYQNSETYFVYEPDFLVDITAIAECFCCREILPDLYFLPYIKSTEYSLSMFKGIFVNNLLDAIISGREIDIDADFARELDKQILKTYKFPPDKCIEVLSEIKNIHLENLFTVAETYAEDTITLEPNFISAQFGIQGRLDALIETNDGTNLKSVFELKSGNPPHSSYWQNNYAQVIGYNLVLKSVFGSDWTGHTSILYSKAEKEALRNVTYSHIAAKNFLMCRNIIVGKILALTENKTQIADYLFEVKNKNIPVYQQKELDKFLTNYKSLLIHEVDYYNVLVSNTLREMIAKKLGYIDSSGFVRPGFSSLWNATLEQKLEQQQFLQISYESHNSDENTFRFTICSDQFRLTNLRVGDILIIYPSKKGEPKPLSVPVFKTVIVSIDDKNIVIRCRNEYIDPNLFAQYRDFYLEPDLMDSTMIGTIANLTNFIYLEATKRDILLGISVPRFTETIKIDLEGSTYDRIMKKSLYFQDYLLIQGPPGTGKTSRYLIDIVKQHKAKEQKEIVICAYTHRAVDEICQRLRENEIDFILLSNDPAKRDNEQIAEWLRNFQLTKPNEPKYIPVFVSTILHFQSDSSYLREVISYDLLIVDEASQILEANLIGLVSLFKKFILIGDHFQLPAISISEKSKISTTLSENIGMHSHAESLFERLYQRCLDKNWLFPIDILDEHYRMHSDIAKLINPFYFDKLLAKKEKQHEKLTLFYSSNISILSEIQSLLISYRLLFFDTKERSNNRYNREEAEKVLNLVQSIYELSGDDFSEKSVGIICTWRLQINLIASLLSSLPFFSLITIDTVERFQGTERDIIIYTTAVSKESDMERMLSPTQDGQVDRKLNVAISRAKEQFILLGNEELLSLSPHYRRVINDIRSI
jgi:DNA replication ATP-dependent helicase Dna2